MGAAIVLHVQLSVPITEKRVFLVDDDPSLLRLLKQWLTDQGLAVNAFGSFNDAKQLLLTAPPDLLLTDVRLGAFNGLQLVILAKQVNAKTSAIIMSAFDDPALRREAEASGATAYLVKPFNRDAFVTAVRQAFAEPVVN
jgi:DNA-binding NtrC family response regulator